MNCYFHPETEGVVSCGKCGVAMCRDCEANAFMRLNNGTGQALCNRCSLDEAQANVDSISSWLTKRLIKLVICAILIVVGLIFIYNDGTLFRAFVCWFFAGVISKIGQPKPQESVKDQAWNAMFEYEHPFMSMIFSAIGYTLLGPIMLIANFIGYLRTKSVYKEAQQTLQTIQSALNV